MSMDELRKAEKVPLLMVHWKWYFNVRKGFIIETRKQSFFAPASHTFKDCKFIPIFKVKRLQICLIFTDENFSLQGTIMEALIQAFPGNKCPASW